MDKDLVSRMTVDENSATTKTARKGSKLLHLLNPFHCKEIFQREHKLPKLLA
jgi:hypothetical protein